MPFKRTFPLRLVKARLNAKKAPGVVRALAALVVLSATSGWPQSADLRTTAINLNNALLRLHGEMQGAAPSEAAELRKSAGPVIQQRAAALAALIEQDPRQALSVAFSADLLADLGAKFPDSAAQLETWGTWKGPVERWIFDNAELKSSREALHMRAGQRTLEVHFAGPEPDGLRSGGVLRASGVLVGNALLAESGAQAMAAASMRSLRTSLAPKATTTTQAAPTCSTTGVQNTAVLLVTFPGATPPSNITPQSVYDMFFASPGPSLDAYWREVSYGQTSATGDVFGWYTLDSSYANCGRLDLLRDAAITAASNSGVNVQNYQRIFIVTTDFGCGWTGLSMGTCTTLNSPTGSFIASASFLNASWQRSQTEGAENAAHEGGHNLGLAHAQSRTFGSEPLGPLGSAGTVTEYGDPFSDMSCSNIGHYATPHKAELLNWISSGTNYQVVQSSGTWTLQPLEINPAGLVALKVQRGTGNNAWLWVEYRQAIGIYDSTIWPPSGALIHYEDSTTGGHTQLLDFTPGTATTYDAALMPGNTWVDPYTNVSITVDSATSSGLTVSVNYGAVPCTPSAPSVGVSPLNPSLYPGQSVGYSVSITNNDTAGCSSSTFNLSSSQPSGWSTSFSTPSLTLSPGQSGSVTMDKGAPSGTPAGTYTVDANAADTSASGSGTASATVMTPPSLTASLTVSGTSFMTGQTVYFTTTVLNGGAAAGGAKVTYSLTKADGSQTSKTVTANSSGTAKWSDKIGPKDPRGIWSVIARAASGSQTATSNSVSFTVQ